MIDMAHAMPQSLAPFAGAWLPTVAVAGAFVVLPVKKAK
jgi:hypothetical protein